MELQTTAKKILTQADLDQCYGSETIWKNGVIHYTDGIKYLAQNAECYWLLSMIGSHRRTILRYSEYESFGLWLLTIAPDNSATLTFSADTGEEPLIREQIPYTDFLTHCDINPIKLYQQGGVLLLPSEY
jgi:hypothetical protein